MKKNANVLVLILFFSVSTAYAQLRGEGKVISKEFNDLNFQSLSILDFDGAIEIEVGKPYKITVNIDQNLESRLSVAKDSDKLTIKLMGNKNGKLYLENTRIKIKVSLPALVFLEHRGNTKVDVTGINSAFFKIHHQGNGDVYLQGETNEIDIYKLGNGSIYGESLITKLAKINTQGNGNVTVNASLAIKANGVGNGNIIQVGKGKIGPFSGVIGNGEVQIR